MKAINIKHIVSVEFIEELKSDYDANLPFGENKKASLIIETVNSRHLVEFNTNEEAKLKYNEILKNINYV